MIFTKSYITASCILCPTLFGSVLIINLANAHQHVRGGQLASLMNVSKTYRDLKDEQTFPNINSDTEVLSLTSNQSTYSKLGQPSKPFLKTMRDMRLSGKRNKKTNRYGHNQQDDDYNYQDDEDSGNHDDYNYQDDEDLGNPLLYFLAILLLIGYLFLWFKLIRCICRAICESLECLCGRPQSSRSLASEDPYLKAERHGLPVGLTREISRRHISIDKGSISSKVDSTIPNSLSSQPSVVKPAMDTESKDIEIPPMAGLAREVSRRQVSIGTGPKYSEISTKDDSTALA